MSLDMRTQLEQAAQDQQQKPYAIARVLIYTWPVALAAIQLLPAPSRTNPRIDAKQTMEASLAVPSQVSGMLQRACSNCHSSETHWPWYSRIAPASWLIGRDVHEARKAMNLSRWASQNGRRPELAVATLTAACFDVRNGRMPKWNYTLLHPEARVSKLEADQFCAWSQMQARLLSRKKPLQQTRTKVTRLLQTSSDRH
jgi:hypothetical protein